MEVSRNEDKGKVIITKASLLSLSELQKGLRKDAAEQGLTEEDLLLELEEVREELWNEWRGK